MRALVVVVFAGCGATAGSSSRPLTCDAVIASLIARSKAFTAEVWGDRQPAASKMMDDMIARIEPVIVQSCRDDRWSDELLVCLDRIEVTDDPHKCNSHFTRDQAVGLARRMLAITQRTESLR